jgi:hypothetical protein
MSKRLDNKISPRRTSSSVSPLALGGRELERGGSCYKNHRIISPEVIVNE